MGRRQDAERGRFADRPDRPGTDDLITARFIDALVRGDPVDADAAASAVAATDEAARTLTLGDGHVHPDDISYATRVDAFDFAMEVDRTGPTPVLRIERAVSGTSE